MNTNDRKRITRTSTRNNRKNNDDEDECIVVLNSDSEKEETDTKSIYEGRLRPKRQAVYTFSDSSSSSSPPSSQPSSPSSFQYFDSLFQDEENEDEDEALKRALLESSRMAEIEAQNAAYEKTMLEDSLLAIEREKKKARETRYERASSRSFEQSISLTDPQVSISVLLPSCKISKTWLLNTTLKTVLEWVSTELIKHGDEYMEDEIRLVDRVSSESVLTSDASMTLEMMNVLEPTVFIVQYLPNSPKSNKRHCV